jgi:hypothetical protein
VTISVAVSLCIAAAYVLGQSVPSRLIIDTQGIRVTADDDFPRSLAVEITVGPESYPCFRTRGGQRLDAAAIDISKNSSVSVLAKVRGEGFVLYFFSEDSDGRVFGLFDLNVDGHWDVKRSPTRDDKQFILLRGQWLCVDIIDGLLDESPVAKTGGKVYGFTKSGWEPQ